MDKQKGLNYLLESRFKTLLSNENVTDISYNGVDVFLTNNITGREKSNIDISQQEARDFIRQIANICEKQFSFSHPYLDVSIDKYRINATHQSIGRVHDEEALTFCIRITSNRIRVKEDSEFFTPPLIELFDILLYSHCSIVIGGVPGCGKTEFQKYLLSRLSKDQKVIAIDNILELEGVRNYVGYDFGSWQYDEQNKEASINLLVKQALRNNPDWLVVAEARGKEMNEILNSALTGVPIITTVHAFDADSIPTRMCRMAMMSSDTLDYDSLLQDINYHFHFFVHMKKVTDRKGNIKRYIASIVAVDRYGNHQTIYKNDLKHKDYCPINKTCLAYLSYDDGYPDFIEAFIGEKHE